MLVHINNIENDLKVQELEKSISRLRTSNLIQSWWVQEFEDTSQLKI